MKVFVEKGPPFEETRNARGIVNRRVLTKTGGLLGRVWQVRLRNRMVEGLLVRRMFRPPVYIGMEYVKQITGDAVLLDIDPVLYEGRSVITLDGKRVGRVVDVLRKGTSNEVAGFIIRDWWRTKKIMPDDIKSLGPTIMLKELYEQFRY